MATFLAALSVVWGGIAAFIARLFLRQRRNVRALQAFEATALEPSHGDNRAQHSRAA